MKPRISILSQAFKYVPSYGTDIRRTFARVLREQRIRARAEAKSVRAAGAMRLVAANDTQPEDRDARVHRTVAI
jgi:hypothetical protein